MIPSLIATGKGAERFEKIPLSIYSSSLDAIKSVAKEISDLIREKEKKKEICVLGLATGVSPIRLYNELVRLHKEEGLSFKNVVTFNLDEYLPMERESEHSYWYFMHTHLFDRIDILPENINIPDGRILENLEITEFCKKYEQKIDSYGGIDLQILGIGRTGHIGFNEPGSTLTSLTRKVFLNDLTMRDASGEFGGLENVPKMAITMGVGTIMKAKKVILMAWGEKKGSIIAKTLESPISDQCPATFLQRHHNCEFVIDEAAASELTRTKKPWLVCNDIKWTKQLIKKAVINLCFEVKKPILKLTSKDYIDHGLINLVKQYETANKVNIEVFNQVQHTITGWPGGKPNVDDLTRPERNSPFPKTTLVFSPHPDDDVLHMGGTLARLVEQGNNVHVVYQTTGNIAVTDDYVIQELDLCINFATLMNIDAAKLEELKELRQLFVIRQPGEVHSQDILQYKTSVLESESRAACRFLKIPEENIHFLRMPFYETGMIQKKSLSNEDIESVVKIMREVKPHQIFAAGDLVDPHGTHYLCLEAIVRALNIVDQDDWFKDCYIWLYRGAQYEWELEKIDMAVPLSPSELDIKNKAIYRHGSQCNFPAFPGEFRQNAEKRNRNNAVLYDKLGMAEYEAIEAFARYHFKHGDYLIKP